VVKDRGLLHFETATHERVSGRSTLLSTTVERQRLSKAVARCLPPLFGPEAEFLVRSFDEYALDKIERRKNRGPLSCPTFFFQ
jgi:hypothetical protein